MLDLSESTVFAAAEATAAEMGWEIVDVVPTQGHIEATDTTALFGFKDDIAIRVNPNPSGQGTVLDIRSASRVGQSDLGANATRIEKFLKAIQARLNDTSSPS